MATLHTKFTLNTGAKIPAVGFGTWQDKDAQEDATLEALKAGYRHIDTAFVYGTEAAVGKALKKSGIPRSEIFVTTKLWNNKHHPEDVPGALEASLKLLDSEYIDLYLMHWPVAFQRGDELLPKGEDGVNKTEKIDFVDTYKALEGLLKTGKVKAIGISNFSQAEIERLLKETTIVPAAHQVEMHPWLQQKSFDAFHKKHNIHLSHYSPFGNQNDIYATKIGKLMDDPTLVEIGKKYNKSGGQIALAWGINAGHSVLPKSKTPARIAANLASDIKLSSEDMEKIAAIDKKLRFNDPSPTFGYEFYVGEDGKGGTEPK